MPEVMKSETQEMSEEEWEKSWKLYRSTTIIKRNLGNKKEIVRKCFYQKIESINKLLNKIDLYEGERIEKIKSKLEENLQNISEKFEYDKNRLEQELIFYIEKLDVNEEKVRLKQHLDYFLETMKEKSPGKKLGFIAQEIGREINTLGSKSNHGEMQKIVVLMKDELEQIKEQVLNVL
jgi:uncharacterized protein (TIGR00255 family)